MKIMHILYNPWQGGTEEVIYLLAKEAIKDGQEVEFVFGKDGPFVKRAQDLGCRIHFVKMRSPFDPIAIWKLYKLFKSIRPDVVHTHFLRENFLAIVAGRLAGVKAIFSSVHRLEPKSKIQAFFNRSYSKGITSFIATSKAVEKYLLDEKIKPEKVKLVYNGVEIQEARSKIQVTRDKLQDTSYKRQETRYKIQETRNKIQVTRNNDQESNFKKKELPDGFKVCFVGRLAPEKNVSLLLKAQAEIERPERPDVLIVGDGPERKHLESEAESLKINDTVSFEGHTDNPGLYYRQADVLVLPSEREALGMVVLEACTYGVPVVTSGVDGVSEIIKDGENGLFFERGNAKDLAEKVKKIKNDPDLYKKLSKNAYKRANDFLSEKMYRGIKSLYEAAV